MQGAEDEAEGSVLTYVTEAEIRKQRSRSPSCNSLFLIPDYQISKNLFDIMSTVCKKRIKTKNFAQQ